MVTAIWSNRWLAAMQRARLRERQMPVKNAHAGATPAHSVSNSVI